jgi:carbon monoxide dehydrogenase subunit G
MKFEHTVVVSAPKERVRAFLEDVPVAARCLPGVEEVRAVEPDVYEGRVRVKIGPLGLTIQSRGRLDRSAGDDIWRLDGEGRDSRAGAGVKTSLQAELSEAQPGSTEVAIEADVQFSGRLAELGQPLIKRKAESMIREFGENLQRALAG